MDDPALWTDEHGNVIPWLQDWLYDRRSSLFVWAVVVLLGLGLAFLVGWRIHEFNKEWLNGTGPWSLILVAGGSPIAWFIWFVRDRNKAADILIEQHRNRHRSVEHAWGIFRELENWATTSQSDALQASAIYQLRPFILGIVEGPVPREAIEPTNPFAQAGVAIIRTLLDDRRWETRWRARLEPQQKTPTGGGTLADLSTGKTHNEEKKETPRSPVAIAIESLLREEKFPTREFFDWNLSGLELLEVKWPGRQLWRANLSGAILWRANLSDADLWNADLSGAWLWGANLEGADFTGATVEGAFIDRKWEKVFDWKALGVKGEPKWIDEEEEGDS